MVTNGAIPQVTKLRHEEMEHNPMKTSLNQECQELGQSNLSHHLMTWKEQSQEVKVAVMHTIKSLNYHK